jgi:uncharacterized membrane protein YesL
MIENLIAIAVLIVFALYFNYSISLVNLISDEMLFNQLSLKRVIHKLNLFKKVMLILGLPIILPVGLVLYLISLLFRFRAR